MDRVDAGPVDLGDIGGPHQDERDQAPEEHVVGDPGQLQRGHADAQQRDDEDAGEPPEQVDVDHRQCSEGEERGSGQAAHHRQQE
jgi:hypothetical protein